MPNHLSAENSPYLLQHANNPVDWFPWGDEALGKARRENKPIFLSIGYAACHWCHVMEHESFEDARTAQILNDSFVSIKVDREQRPDLDSIYMQATTVLTGSGGWPMSVFLTPDLRPFYAGTYFPPVRRFNLPAFTDVLLSIVGSWKQDPTQVDRVASEVLTHLHVGGSSNGRDFDGAALDAAAQKLVTAYDNEFGGWGAAPKFPQPMVIEFLLRRAATGRGLPRELEVALHALRAMARGGIYDVVGGGFSRYSTDVHWRVPHFEKMLYDNAQLSLAYLHAYQLSREAFFKDVVVETLDFTKRELMHRDGGFYSSLDADSPAGEGAYYVWAKDRIQEALGDDALFACVKAAYGITERGNWEGSTVLQRTLDDASLAAVLGVSVERAQERLKESHRRLLWARETRPRPATDDKVLTAWNGLALSAYATAARCFGNGDESTAELMSVATRNAAFILEQLCPDGKLRRTWRSGRVGREVFLEDYASLIIGLLDLYQVDFNNTWFAAARRLAKEMIERFADAAGGFFDTPDGEANLLLRPKDVQDSATPSGNALACEALLKLAAFTGEGAYRDRAEASLRLIAEAALEYPLAFGRWLNAADFAVHGGQQLAILAGKPQDTLPLLAAADERYRPDLIVAGATLPLPPDAPDLLVDRPLLDGRATAYVCRDFVCRLPVSDPQALRQQL